MIIFKIRIFKLSKIDQGIYKLDIQKKIGIFSLFEKNYPEKQKKLIFVHPGLRYPNKN